MAGFYGTDYGEKERERPFPVRLKVTLKGKDGRADADAEIKRGTVLSRTWSRRYDRFIYEPLINWTIADADINGENIEIVTENTTPAGSYRGAVSKLFIDPTRITFHYIDADGLVTGQDVNAVFVIDPVTGKYKVTTSVTSEDLDGDGIPDFQTLGGYGISYYYGDQDGKSWPVGIMVEDTDIETTNDVNNVEIYVWGGFNQKALIYPTGASVDDVRGFVAVMSLKGLPVK